MGIFNRNKNPKSGFKQDKQAKPMDRKKKAKMLKKKGYSDQMIEYGFMLEENAPIAIAEFNKCVQMIERLGFKPEVSIRWHGTGCDSSVTIVPVPSAEFFAMQKADEAAKAEKAEAEESEANKCKNCDLQLDPENACCDRPEKVGEYMIESLEEGEPDCHGCQTGEKTQHEEDCDNRNKQA